MRYMLHGPHEADEVRRRKWCMLVATRLRHNEKRDARVRWRSREGDGQPVTVVRDEGASPEVVAALAQQVDRMHGWQVARLVEGIGAPGNPSLRWKRAPSRRERARMRTRAHRGGQNAQNLR